MTPLLWNAISTTVWMEEKNWIVIHVVFSAVHKAGLLEYEVYGNLLFSYYLYLGNRFFSLGNLHIFFPIFWDFSTRSSL